jgi:hypothetical protein
MIGGEWKRAGGSTKSPFSSVQAVSRYRTPVGVISRLVLFRLVAFGGRSAMGWSVPFSFGELLVEGPLLASRLETNWPPLRSTIETDNLR